MSAIAIRPKAGILVGALGAGALAYVLNEKVGSQNGNYSIYGSTNVHKYASAESKANNQNDPNGTNASKNTLKALFGGVAARAAVVPEGKSYKDYQDVYNSIAEKVREDDDVDQGAGRYGLLTRLAWHTSGTYTKKNNSGGSYGGGMIYAPEALDGENAGLETGRDFLVEFSYKYPWLSRGDLWTLGGVVAVQESGGPKIKWRPGRVDASEKQQIPKNGLLPDASRDAPYVRGVFSRMGFSDQETVALIGAHCLGRCHTWRSGFDGPWTPAFNMFTNDFYVQLLEGWHVRKWDGPKQYEDDNSGSLMMLPTDMALKEDSSFLKYVKMYAKDQDLFFADFSKAFTKLLENGIDFKGREHWEFRTLDEQEE